MSYIFPSTDSEIDILWKCLLEYDRRGYLLASATPEVDEMTQKGISTDAIDGPG